MKIKTKYLNVTKESILGEGEIFSLVQKEDFNGYDKEKKQSTGVRAGTRYTIMVFDVSKELMYDKLDVRILGEDKIPQYNKGETVDCKFTNLQIRLGSVEYGKAEITATADSIQLVIKDKDEIKGQIKLNMKEG